MRTINLKILAMVMSLLMFCSSVMPTSVSAAESLDIDYHSNHESCDSDHCEDDHGHEHENGDETVVKIAIFDTGISGTFVVGGKSFVDYTDSWADDNGHGTAMAETLVDALTVDAEIYSVKVLDSNGIGTHDDIVEALAWAVENDMDIVALSFAGKDNTAGLDAAVEYAYDNGILVIAAAGNDGSNNASFPASYEEALSVGASDVEGAVAGYSNYGDYVDVYALGTYGEQGGTSVAVQIIAAKAAAMLDADCEMSVFSLREELAGAEMKDEPECEYVSEGVVEATACAHTGKQTTKAATCTSAGYKKVTCTKCNATLSNTTIAKLGHSYKTTTTPPTCTATGKTVKKCTRCSSTTTTTIPVLGHSYTVTTTAATCTADGKKVTKCSRCGVSTTSVIAKLGHSYTTTTTAATCTADGKTVKKCTRCSYGYTKLNEAEGHEYELTKTEYPSCTNAGRVVTTCKKCGDVQETLLNASGHDYEWTKTDNSTCTESGRIVTTCTKCGDEQETPLKPSGHNNIATTVLPTCTATGSLKLECTICGFVSITSIPTVGHNYSISAKAPTCTTSGSITKECVICNYKVVDTFAKLGHDKVYVPGKLFAECKRCNGCINIENEESVGGHVYTEMVTYEKTCLVDGYSCLRCEKCGSEQSDHFDIVPATGTHDFSGQTLVTTSSDIVDESGNLVCKPTPCEKYIKCKNCSMYQLVVSNHNLVKSVEIGKTGTKIAGTIKVACSNYGCEHGESAKVDISVNLGVGNDSRTYTFAPTGYATTPNGAGGTNVLLDDFASGLASALEITNNSENATCSVGASNDWIHIYRNVADSKKYRIKVDDQEGECSARKGSIYLVVQANLMGETISKSIALPITVEQEGYKYNINGMSVEDFTQYLKMTNIVIPGDESEYGALYDYILPEHLKYFNGGVSMHDLDTMVKGNVGNVSYAVNNYVVLTVEGKWETICTFCFWYKDENGNSQFCKYTGGDSELNGNSAFAIDNNEVVFSDDYIAWRMAELCFDSGENNAQNMFPEPNATYTVTSNQLVSITAEAIAKNGWEYVGAMAEMASEVGYVEIGTP